jgi:hypothetical protein
MSDVTYDPKKKIKYQIQITDMFLKNNILNR